MGVNVVTFGGQKLVDLRDATASPESILAGYTAYGADGEKIIGTGPEILRREVTLPADGWADGQQTVAVPGVTDDNMVIVSVDRWGVGCVTQGAGALTFYAAIPPPQNVTANVYVISHLT